MDFILGLTSNFIATVLVTLLFSCGISVIVVGKIRQRVYASARGIKKIYKDCYETRKIMMESLDNAKELFFFAVIADEFTKDKDYKDKIQVAFQQGLDCKVLVAKPDSEYIKDLWKLRGFDNVEEVRERIARVKEEWEQIVNFGNNGKNPKGTIEIRHFSTEITNQVVICKRNDESYISWVTLALPPKRGINSIQIEFVDKDRIDECISYFNSIWKIHDKDVLYSYPPR